METLIAATKTYVESYMSQPHFDASHDYAHIERVWALARRIAARERRLSEGTANIDGDGPTPEVSSAGQAGTTMSAGAIYDDNIIALAALLHDVGDRKYISQPPTPSTNLASGGGGGGGGGDGGSGLPGASASHISLVHDFLRDNGASLTLAQTIQTIVTHVSYTTEMKTDDRAQMRVLLERYPELGVVQDADRLDAMGAVGVGRCFAFCGARSARRRGAHPRGEDARGETGGAGGLESAIEHFGEKLEKLEGLMKTRAGRELARSRAERLRVFRDWWREEMAEMAEF